jgi:hypothetical protein
MLPRSPQQRVGWARRPPGSERPGPGPCGRPGSDSLGARRAQARATADAWEKRARQLQQKYGKVDLAEHQGLAAELAAAREAAAALQAALTAKEAELAQARTRPGRPVCARAPVGACAWPYGPPVERPAPRGRAAALRSRARRQGARQLARACRVHAPSCKLSQSLVAAPGTAAAPWTAVRVVRAALGPQHVGRGVQPPARRATLTRAHAAGAGAGGQGARQGAGDDRQEAPAPAQPGQPHRQGVCQLPRAARGDAGARGAGEPAPPRGVASVRAQEGARRQPAPAVRSASVAAWVSVRLHVQSAGACGSPDMRAAPG